MQHYVGKTIQYTNRLGKTVTATVTRVEKLRRPFGAIGLYHVVDGQQAVVTAGRDVKVVS